jgi:hypothetical protein
MSIPVQRVALTVLLISALYVGGWAVVDPTSFYASFPGLGHRWVAVDGPFNEHLVRDVGGLYLALAAITAVALVRGDRASVSLCGLAWTPFSVLHLAYHAGHLGKYGTADAVGNAASLGLTLLLALGLLISGRSDVRVATREG